MGPYDSIIREYCWPLEAIPTAEPRRLYKLSNVRVVLFDVYGTLLISPSGDLNPSRDPARGAAFVDALAAVGIAITCDGDVGVQHLLQIIESDHQRAHVAGTDFPEVDIVDVWCRTLSELDAGGWVDAGGRTVDLRRLAIEYEVRVNPVWPMPNARPCLEQLYRSGIMLGVISNAQFMTVKMLQVLLETPPADFQFDPDLQYYSYQHGRAKPGLHLYQLAAKTLAQRGIDPLETLYVGNDMLNDVLPASRVGFRTALFAGDARSLRRRVEEPRVTDAKPDLVLTDLLDLLQCVL